jgi:tetratricopeptide (TPR) repeat protein
MPLDEAARHESAHAVRNDREAIEAVSRVQLRQAYANLEQFDKAAEAYQKAAALDPDNLDAWSAYHLGLQHMFRFHRDDNAAAGELFARAVRADPTFARAHAGASFVHFQNAFLRYTPDVERQIQDARRFAERSVELDPLDPFANLTMGRSYWLEGDLDTSLSWLERAIAISPSYAQAIYARAWTHALSGRGSAGQGDADLAMALSPLDPLHYAMTATRALSHIVRGEDEAAADWGEPAGSAPGHTTIAVIASRHSLCGRRARGARARPPASGSAEQAALSVVRPPIRRASTPRCGLAAFGIER